MPCRYIQDLLIDDKDVTRASCQAQVLFFRLLLAVDDFGLYFADPDILRGKLFAAAIDKFRPADLSRFLDELEKAGLIRRYDSEDGEPFLHVQKTFGKQCRAKSPKYPPPPWISVHLRTDADGCGQMSANAPDNDNDNDNPLTPSQGGSFSKSRKKRGVDEGDPFEMMEKL